VRAFDTWEVAMPERIDRSEREWRALLSPEAYRVLRRRRTEIAFTGSYWDTKDPGVYRCRGCGSPLFSSEAKYDSGTGWPSFYEPLGEDRVRSVEDRTLLMRRVEVRCAACDGHLGHVFPDGPESARLRYCLNSAALELDPSAGPEGPESPDDQKGCGAGG
jgi:peptide-methionine (R)-S-oxide reductase